jgi:hypothetical protein
MFKILHYDEIVPNFEITDKPSVSIRWSKISKSDVLRNIFACHARKQFANPN